MWCSASSLLWYWLRDGTTAGERKTWAPGTRLASCRPRLRGPISIGSIPLPIWGSQSCHPLRARQEPGGTDHVKMATQTDPTTTTATSEVENPRATSPEIEVQPPEPYVPSLASEAPGIPPDEEEEVEVAHPPLQVDVRFNPFSSMSNDQQPTNTHTPRPIPVPTLTQNNLNTHHM